VDKIDVKVSLCEELENLHDKFLKYHIEVWPQQTGKQFSNQQLRMRVYTKLVVIMVLE
jgi:hypothetical protein